MKNKYLESIKKELLEKKTDDDIYTIYFWWWTPSEFELKRFLELFIFLKNNFKLNKLEELSIELNPKLSSDSFLKDILEFIEQITTFFSKNINNKTKIRFSIWIQSLNNKILKLSNRNYDFEYIETFIKAITNIKNKYTQLSFNLDFISFWLEQTKDFEQFEIFVKENSKTIDSYSIYTLELFEGSIWKDKFKVDDKKILENFKSYYEIIKKYNYERYEISNFSKKWKESLHNLVYWELKNYIWIWTSASWFIKDKNQKAIRYTNTYSIQKYTEWKFEYYEKEILDKNNLIVEKIFLGLRTYKWLKLNKKILKKIDKKKLEEYINLGYIKRNWNNIKLTDKWFDIYNFIITDILEF